MAYENENYATRTQGTATTTLSAITTGLLALGAGNGGNGILGGLFGGNSSQVQSLQEKVQELSVANSILTSETSTDKKMIELYRELAKQDKATNEKIDGVSARVLAIETASPLKEALFDQKIARVSDTMTCCCNATNASIASLQQTIANIGQFYVNATSVTPTPMPKYNSFVAPTSTSTTSTSA